MELELLVKRQVGDFNIVVFPKEWWEIIETYEPGSKIKITIYK